MSFVTPLVRVSPVLFRQSGYAAVALSAMHCQPAQCHYAGFQVSGLGKQLDWLLLWQQQQAQVIYTRVWIKM